MRRFRMRRYVTFSLPYFCLPACTAYHRTNAVAPSTINGQERVILTVADSTGTHSVRLQYPQASRGSLWGIPCNADMSGQGPAWRRLADSRWSAPMKAVIEVRTKKRDLLTTSMAGLLAIGVVAAVVVVTGESARP
jgi:hypothetical protein